MRNETGSDLAVLDIPVPAATALIQRNRVVHLVSRIAPGLSDAALAELASIADQLRCAEGLPPVEFTAQW
ncbi:hypothetical protein [Nocardia sp. XZ_19_385]|uniref:hypothetical protein n=1 Tax=Nocardia sp. XZ_19_385 TaxID=2769488 RepID=UPI001E4D83D3|nr:hypothetical protein [Nocardia sp. XZ_19_385]